VNEFMGAKSDVWSFFDLLWIGLAVVTAFRIPAPQRAREEAATAGGGE
jgi:hypothetical protein